MFLYTHQLPRSVPTPHISYYVLLSVDPLQLLGNLQGPVWTVVIDDDDLIAAPTAEETVGPGRRDG